MVGGLSFAQEKSAVSKMKNIVAGAALALAAGFAASSANAAVIVNGSFEDGPNPGSFTTLANGSTAINGWTVGGNGIDYIGTLWKAADGVRSLDLSALDAGGISQTFATVVGKTYKVSFSLAGNPDGGFGNKVLVTTLGLGQLPEIETFTVGASNTHENMGWQTITYSFVANSTSSTLNFASATKGPYGPALDNVVVSAVPEPATWAMMIVGFGAAGTMVRNRRKLGAVAA